jgi:hypothetical protein
LLHNDSEQCEEGSPSVYDPTSRRLGSLFWPTRCLSVSGPKGSTRPNPTQGRGREAKGPRQITQKNGVKIKTTILEVKTHTQKNSEGKQASKGCHHSPSDCLFRVPSWPARLEIH